MRTRFLDEIRREKVRGARWCLLKAIEGLEQMCREGFIDSVDRIALANEIRNTIPSMAPLRLLALVVERSSDICKAISFLRRFAENSMEAIARELDKLLYGSITVISYSSTLLEALPRCRRVDSVYVLESRPGGEGVAFAKELRSRGIDVKIVPDSMARKALEHSTAAVFGADAIDYRCRILNKVGSSTLAAIAKYLGLDVITVLDATKILIDTECYELENLVMRSYCYDESTCEELPVFECVDPRDVTLIVTDGGAFPPVPDLVRRWMIEFLRSLGLEIQITS